MSPPQIPAADLSALAPPMHSTWVTDDTGIRTACGKTWRRGEPRTFQATAQNADVTCVECVKTLKAAGLAVGSYVEKPTIVVED